MSANNPDRERLRAFMRDPATPLVFDSSPLLAALGTTLVAGGEGRIVLDFKPAALFRQGAGVVQGGAVSAMLDFAIAAAVMTKIDAETHFATASLTVSFLAPVREGILRAEAEVDRIGRRNGFAHASLRDGANNVLATASSVLTLIPPER